MPILKSLLIWLFFIPVAIVNGGLREYVLNPLLGQWALPLSGILLSAFIFWITWGLFPRIGEVRRSERYGIAGLWVVLTVLFEFGFGLQGGLTMREMLSAYNPMTGNLWIVVLSVTAIAPLVVRKK